MQRANAISRHPLRSTLWLSFLIFLQVPAFAQVTEEAGWTGEARNLSNIEDATKAADEMLANTQMGDQVVVYHTSNDIPSTLKYVLQRAAHAHLPVRVVKITPENLAADFAALENTPKPFQEVYTYGEAPGYTWKTLLGEAKGFVKRIFGAPDPEAPRGDWRRLSQDVRRIPNRVFGVANFKKLSLWIKIPRAENIRRFDLSRAAISGSIAGLTLGGSFVLSYAINHQAPDLSILRPILALGAWVGLNMYYFRAIHEVMSQGKTLARTPTGWKIAPNSPFFWTTNFIRGFISNAVIGVAKFGPEAILSGGSLAANAQNSFVNIFSRSEIDKVIAAKTPTTKGADGKIIVLEGSGQWSEKTAANMNLLWTSTHGMIKNLQFIANDPHFQAPVGFKIAMNAIFGGLAIINVGMMLKPVLPGIKDKISDQWKTLQATQTRWKVLINAQLESAGIQPAFAVSDEEFQSALDSYIPDPETICQSMLTIERNIK